MRGPACRNSPEQLSLCPGIDRGHVFGPSYLLEVSSGHSKERLEEVVHSLGVVVEVTRQA